MLLQSIKMANGKYIDLPGTMTMSSWSDGIDPIEAF